jgi:small subunit ribosomal protein S8
MLTDPIANFLTRIRNASHARRGTLTVRSSRMIKSIAQLLTTKRFIEGFDEETDGKIVQLAIRLRVDRE